MNKKDSRFELSGFVDWNEYDMAEIVSYLETLNNRNYINAPLISKMVEFYLNSENGKKTERTSELDEISDNLNKYYYFSSSGIAFSVNKIIKYYKDKTEKMSK